MEVSDNLDNNQTIRNFLTNFRINYNGEVGLQRTQILKNNIVITLKFVDEKDTEIIKEIEVSLHDIKDNE